MMSIPSDTLENIFTSPSVSFKDRLLSIQKSVSQSLELILKSKQDGSDATPSKLYEAMAYATRGGKCLRSYLFLSSCYTLGYDFKDPDLNKNLILICCAIEALQTYSLIHDDLPGMDNSSLRRGQPATHIQFDHHTAILAGSALQNLSFELLSNLSLEPQQSLALIQSFSVLTGGEGMMGGQQWDMDFEKSHASLRESQITTMLSLKTGAFFRACCQAAHIVVPQQNVSSLDAFAIKFGLLFQVYDDLLDQYGSTEDLGKPALQDAKKRALIALWGPEATLSYFYDLYAKAEQDLDSFDNRGMPLLNLIQTLKETIETLTKN